MNTPTDNPNQSSRNTQQHARTKPIDFAYSRNKTHNFNHIYIEGAPAVGKIDGGGGGAATSLSGAAGELTLQIGATGSSGFPVLRRLAPFSP